MNARWYPAPAHKDPKRPKQAIVVMPQWNADAFSHNALCTMVNWFGVSALRLSKPYHDIRRPSGAGAFRLCGERKHWADDFGMPAGGGGYSLLHRLAGGAGVRALRRAGDEPGLVLCISRERARQADPGECVQPCVNGVWRCGVGGAEHAACAAGAGRSGTDAGSNSRLWSAVSPVSFYDKIMRAAVRRATKRVLLVYANYDPDVSEGVFAARWWRHSSGLG